MILYILQTGHSYPARKVAVESVREPVVFTTLSGLDSESAKDCACVKNSRRNLLVQIERRNKKLMDMIANLHTDIVLLSIY